MKDCLKAILQNSIAFVYHNIETIILSFIFDNITQKNTDFHAKNMEVMDKTVIQNNYPETEKRVKQVLFYILNKIKLWFYLFNKRCI